jgi:catechol 2,3-dioxygenase-like lactoylglutathione lyase family enzyme
MAWGVRERVTMGQSIAAVALVVRDYDEAIAFYTGCLGFTLVEDTPPGGGKRWVVVAPPGGGHVLDHHGAGGAERFLGRRLARRSAVAGAVAGRPRRAVWHRLGSDSPLPRSKSCDA